MRDGRRKPSPECCRPGRTSNCLRLLSRSQQGPRASRAGSTTRRRSCSAAMTMTAFGCAARPRAPACESTDSEALALINAISMKPPAPAVRAREARGTRPTEFRSRPCCYVRAIGGGHGKTPIHQAGRSPRPCDRGRRRRRPGPGSGLGASRTPIQSCFRPARSGCGSEPHRRTNRLHLPLRLL